MQELEKLFDFKK